LNFEIILDEMIEILLEKKRKKSWWGLVKI